jgi:class 3 adenylate cyclase
MTQRLRHHADVQASVGPRRRQATVLFADLTGFATLVECLEPEDVYACVRPLIDELVRLVETHGGEIQQVLGDGFMAVFGLQPDSHDAEETVRAAVTAGVALIGAGQQWNGRLPVHVGIECGEVLVSVSWEPAQYAVWGRPVTVAARLCDLASPHTLNVGPQAFELGGRYAVDQLGGQVSASMRAQPKGFYREILVHTVTAPRHNVAGVLDVRWGS